MFLFVPGGGRGAESANSLKRVTGMSQQICRKRREKKIVHLESKSLDNTQRTITEPLLCAKAFEMDQMTGESALRFKYILVRGQALGCVWFAVARREMNVNGRRLASDPGLC